MDVDSSIAPDTQYCATCGDALTPGPGQDTLDGSICNACKAKQEAARARKVAPLAWLALLVALVPTLFGYTVESRSTGHSSSSSTSTRFLIFTSSSSNSFNHTATGDAEPPAMYSYSNPIPLPAGALALVLAAAAAWSVLRATPRSTRGLVVVGLAMLLGARSLWNGYRDRADTKAQPFTADKSNYLGDWQAEGVSLKIGEDRSVDYNNETAGNRYEGALRRFKGNDLLLRRPSGDITLTVQKPPTKKDGMWTMTVEGSEVARKDKWALWKENVERSLVNKLGPLKGVAAVTCPVLKETEEQLVVCEGTLKNGKKADLKVTLKGDDYQVNLQVFDKDAAEWAAEWSKKISDKDETPVVIDCGTEHIYSPIGSPFLCDVKEPDNHMHGTIRFVINADDSLDWEKKMERDTDAPAAKGKHRKAKKH